MHATNSPTHEAITRRAKEIWNALDRPIGHDASIWLDAERQLTGVPAKPAPHQGTALLAAPGSMNHPQPFAPSSTAPVVTEPPVAHHSTSQSPAPDPDDIAAKTARQKKSARAPRLPKVINAPKSAPTESGKPLWDKPHSS